jgi:hypothetical protein
MNLLIYAHRWAPETGGVEIISAALARGISTGAAGWKVTLATPTPAGGMNDLDLPFRVVRRPGTGVLTELVKEADLVHLAGAALLPLILCILFRKRVVIEHHGFVPMGNWFWPPPARHAQAQGISWLGVTVSA